MPQIGHGKFGVAVGVFHLGQAGQGHRVVGHGAEHGFGQLGHGDPVAVLEGWARAGVCAGGGCGRWGGLGLVHQVLQALVGLVQAHTLAGFQAYAGNGRLGPGLGQLGQPVLDRLGLGVGVVRVFGPG